MICIMCQEEVADGKFCCSCGWNQNQEPSDVSVSLEMVYNRWKQSNFHKITPQSQATYENAFSKLAMIHHLPIDSVRAFHFQDCIDEMVDYSLSYQQKVKTVCMHIMKYAIKHEMITAKINYASLIDLYSTATVETKEILTEDEINTLYRYALDKGNKYWQAARILVCLAYTGFRPNEFFDLTKESVLAKERCLVGGGKTEAGRDRMVPIAQKISAFIFEWYLSRSASTSEEKSHLVQTTNGKRMSLHNWIKRQLYPMLLELDINKLGEKRRITAYCGRHTFASLCFRANVKSGIMIKMIGHTNADFTNKTYIHSVTEEYHHEMQKVDELG